MRYTSQQDLEATIGRRLEVKGNRLVRAEAPAAAPAKSSSAGAGTKAIAREQQDGPRMNKTERRYRDEILEPALRAALIRKYRFEALNLRMGENTFHRPDFYVVLANGAIQIHEVKGGFIRPDALTKWKIAAQEWSEYTWQMWQWKDRKWTKIREQ